MGSFGPSGGNTGGAEGSAIVLPGVFWLAVFWLAVFRTTVFRTTVFWLAVFRLAVVWLAVFWLAVFLTAVFWLAIFWLVTAVFLPVFELLTTFFAVTATPTTLRETTIIATATTIASRLVSIFLPPFICLFNTPHALVCRTAHASGSKCRRRQQNPMYSMEEAAVLKYLQTLFYLLISLPFSYLCPQKNPPAK